MYGRENALTRRIWAAARENATTISAPEARPDFREIIQGVLYPQVMYTQVCIPTLWNAAQN